MNSDKTIKHSVVAAHEISEHAAVVVLGTECQAQLIAVEKLARDPKRPNLPTPLPFSASTLWRKVREGTFPEAVKLGDAITAWRVGDVRKWLAQQANTPAEGAQ